MRRLVIAAGLIMAGATAASAQSITFQLAPWGPSFPYQQRYHSVCQDKAWRLRQFERRSANDGVFTWRERATIRKLRWDLDRTCGKFRWRG